MHVHKLKAFTGSNLKYTQSLVMGCSFESCQMSTENSEFWYCTFRDTYMNLDAFTSLWEEIWSNDLDKLIQFLVEFERCGSGLWLVSTIKEVLPTVTGDQLKQLRGWEPLFSTCEGTLNYAHPRYLITVISNEMIERLITSERSNYLSDADDDYDYNDSDDEN